MLLCMLAIGSTVCPSVRHTVVPCRHKRKRYKMFSPSGRPGTLAERAHEALSRWKFSQVTQGYSRSFEITPLSMACKGSSY